MVIVLCGLVSKFGVGLWLCLLYSDGKEMLLLVVNNTLRITSDDT